jgi:hypothetical protein
LFYKLRFPIHYKHIFIFFLPSIFNKGRDQSLMLDPTLLLPSEGLSITHI